MNIGWTDYFEKQLSGPDDLMRVGRITSEERQYWRILSLKGDELILLTSGKLRRSHRGAEAPGVGDWVVFSEQRSGRQNNEVILEKRLERKSFLKRQSAGDAEDEQLLAANIDHAILTMSLNQDFNRRRLERYLSICSEGSVNPILALTKADLAEDLNSFLEAIKELREQIQIVILRRDQIHTFEELKKLIRSGETAVVLGSSGVGKSTLINFLLGHELQKTATIREDDDKGRHTTTGRSLHFLNDGSMVIDTPGLRELKILAEAESIEEAFPDIAQIALSCKFADCKHVNEPACAVKKAINSGQLSADRVGNFIKLTAEADARMRKKRGY